MIGHKIVQSNDFQVYKIFFVYYQSFAYYICILIVIVFNNLYLVICKLSLIILVH